MSFYSQFATHYERVFPLREGTLAFLRARLPAGSRVLDLGCGTGHYGGALAAAGYRAVGIDLDPAMISAARRAYPDAAFEVCDLRNVGAAAGAAWGTAAPPSEPAAPARPFGGAYCIGNVLPHLAPDELVDFLRALRGVLAPDAPFIVQTVNFDRLLPLREPYRFPDLNAGDGLQFSRLYRPNSDGSIRFVTELRDDARTVFMGEETLWPRLAKDLVAIVASEGFSVRECLGDFAGADFAAERSGALVLSVQKS